MNIKMSSNHTDNNLHPQVSSNIIFFYLSIQIILLAVAAWKEYRGDIIATLIDVFYVVSMFMILYVIGDFLLRLCNLMNDLMNRQNHFNTNPIQLTKVWFNYNVISVMVISTCIICVVIRSIGEKGNTFKEVWMYDTVSFWCLCVFSFILFIVTISHKQNLISGTKSSFINSMKGLDYGTGMAYSFYYGYLKIVLPSTGTASKGILEKIENFEDIHNVTVATKKLFLLIPASTHLPPDLEEVSCQWMEYAQELEEEKRDRAAIKGRSYKNNIYKIYPGGRNSGNKPEYVVAEGATPMLTFFEIQKHYHPESETYKKYRKEIISAFYKKLNDLLNDDPDCRDLCELIYYDDYNPDGKTKVNVAKIVLGRLAELERIQE